MRVLYMHTYIYNVYIHIGTHICNMCAYIVCISVCLYMWVYALGVCI